MTASSSSSSSSSPHDNIAVGAKVLRERLDAVTALHPNWSDTNRLKAAVAAYNAGAKNVRSADDMDAATTNADYSNDVMARAQLFATWSQ